MKNGRLRFYVHAAGSGWVWSLVLSNGAVVARSGWTFTRSKNAAAAARRLLVQLGATATDDYEVVRAEPPRQA